MSVAGFAFGRRIAIAMVIGSLLVACNQKLPNATPEGAVRELIERLRRTSVDPSASKGAYELLSKGTQQRLIERADRYGAASGKHIAPEAMIAPATFLEHFEARGFHSEIVGSHARVRAEGLLADDSAEISCAFEDGAWRVEIPLPPLPPVDVRPRIGQ